MAYLSTITKGYIPDGYFDDDNVRHIATVIQNNLAFDFKNKVLLDRASVIRVMQRVLEQRLEEIPLMNQRVIMELTNEIRTHQIDVNKHLAWEDGYITSQLAYDSIGKKGYDVQGIKLANRLGKPKVGGTVNFYFT
jgi:restriction endonuclease